MGRISFWRRFNLLHLSTASVSRRIRQTHDCSTQPRNPRAIAKAGGTSGSGSSTVETTRERQWRSNFYLTRVDEEDLFDNLIEYDFGEFEGQTAEELRSDPAFREWLAGGADAAAPFGESNGGFQKRVIRAFYDIVNGVIKAGTPSVAVITHGGVIMTIMQTFALPEAPMHEWMTPNGCGYTLNVIPSIWGNTAKAEAFAEIPLRPRREEDEDDETVNWDEEIDPEEFRGFYTPGVQ